MILILFSNLIEDEQGHIWFALYNQLIEYNPVEKVILIHEIFSDKDEYFYSRTKYHHQS